MKAIEEIKSLVDRPDPFSALAGNLRELQLEAVRERFAEKRQQIRVLDQRARDAGIDAIGSLNDLVPLLFSHTNYKGYPEVFIDNGQWNNMNLWFQTLTALPMTGVDVEGVGNADEWMQRLWATGHHAYASSGTSGKCSFLDQSEDDAGMAYKVLEVAFVKAWQQVDARPANDRTVFTTMPATGVHRWCTGSAKFLRELVAKSGEFYQLSDEPLRAAPGIRAGQLRRAMAAGTALPDDVAAFEAENAAQARKMQESMAILCDRIYECRHQPLVLSVQWPQAFQIVQALKARGVKDGEMHPGTMINMGGGIKGVKLPDDFKEQIETFFNVPEKHYSNCYGMVEITALCPRLYDYDGFAIPPWVVPLVLDKSGEHLLNPGEDGGVVEGRMGLFDLLIDSHWGGVISGDKVTVDYSPAGRLAGPLVRTVARYQDLEEGEDKLTCAGTIDSYVRGEIEV